MKKILVFALAILLILAMPACVQEQTAEEETIGRIVTHDDFVSEFSKRVDLNDYTAEPEISDYICKYAYTSKYGCEIQPSERNFQVEIDGIKVTLPMTVQEFADLGFELLVKEDDTEIPANLSAFADQQTFTARTPKGNTVSIHGVSKGYETVALKDLIVVQIVCNFYKNNINYGKGERTDVPDIRFFENITAKSTIDDMVKELKSPNYIDFSQVSNNGKVIRTSIQLVFHFSSQKYSGHIAISTCTTPENVIDRPCYTTIFHYALDNESIRTG